MGAGKIPKVLYDSLFELAKSDREVFITRIGNIQSRTGFILASSGIMASIIPLLAVDNKVLHLNWYLTGGIIFSVLTVLISCIVLWSSKYEIQPSLINFFDDYKSETEDDIKEAILVCISAGDKNSNKTLEDKARWQNVSLITFSISIFLFYIGAFLLK